MSLFPLYIASCAHRSRVGLGSGSKQSPPDQLAPTTYQVLQVGPGDTPTITRGKGIGPFGAFLMLPVGGRPARSRTC